MLLTIVYVVLSFIEFSHSSFLIHKALRISLAVVLAFGFGAFLSSLESINLTMLQQVKLRHLWPGTLGHLPVAMSLLVSSICSLAQI